MPLSPGFLVALAIATVGAARAAVLRGARGRNSTQEPPEGFVSYYAGVTEGRGIWKWNDALVAYDRHLLPLRGGPVAGAEVGVQSGGSLLMWHAVLGPGAVIHGLDINPMCHDFVDAKTSITIGDQENPEMWRSFFDKVTPALDFLVDDGGHFPGQMLQTTYSVFPRLNAGGVLAIEDIHGAHYLQSFFEPLAQYLGPRGEVGSLHLYPYLFVVQKAGGTRAPPYDPTLLPGASIPASGRISDLDGLEPALAAAPPGSLVVLENLSWGRFINPSGLTYFFRAFIDLYQPLAMPDRPPGCADTSAPVCTSGTENSAMQSKVYGVHVLPTKLVVEVARETPVIEAVRHGKVWIRRPANDEIPQRLRGFLNDTSPAHHALPTG